MRRGEDRGKSIEGRRRKLGEEKTNEGESRTQYLLCSVEGRLVGLLFYLFREQPFSLLCKDLLISNSSLFYSMHNVELSLWPVLVINVEIVNA